jgi:homotetrameric cytidine deaminase
MLDYEKLGVSPELVARLRQTAQAARGASYSRYSEFMVLAAVEAPNGVFGGSNVESVNFTLTKHAEEVAILSAILNGAGPEGAWLETLYVTSASPCGSCRQFAAEFGRPKTVVLIDRLSQADVRNANLTSLDESKIEAWYLSDLLPAAFNPGDLRGEAGRD